MRKIIHRLRRQPEEERRHLLHILTFACAIILIILWVYSLNKTITSTETQTRMKQDLKPFTLLKDSIVNSTQN